MRGEFGEVLVHDVTTQWGVFALAGPNVARAARDSWSATPSPRPRSATSASPGSRRATSSSLMCPTVALRVAYTGELGWELHHPIEMQNYLFDRLMEAGEPLGLKLVGARAQNWLRQEKSYRAFGNELGRDATPLEADLPRFVDLGKDFRGQGGDAGDGHPLEMRDAADRRARRRRPLGPRGALRRGDAGRPADLGRLFGRLRQVDRHGLRARRSWRCRGPG